MHKLRDGGKKQYKKKEGKRMSLLKPYIIDGVLCSGEVCDKETLFAGVAAGKRLNWREYGVRQQDAAAELENKISEKANEWPVGETLPSSPSSSSPVSSLSGERRKKNCHRMA